MTKLFSRVLAALMLGFVAQSVWANGDIQIQDPWVQAAPPGAKVLAGYLEIKNTGKKQRVLTGASSPAFGQIGIHRTVMHGDMAHMEHLNELPIPPNASVVFQPGGLHFMLMDAKKSLHVGDQVSMTLTFSNGEKISVTAIVRSGNTDAMENSQHMDHSGHGEHMH